MNPTPSIPIDEDLVALRAGKTSAACAKIVAQYGPLVKAACRRVLRDNGLAEDAAQETFVLLVKKARSLPPGTSLAGWLYHAACRTALNHQRTAMRRRVRETSPEAMNQMTPDTKPDLWTEVEPHLDEAMLTLPERQRDLVVQCYFQSRSQRAAATALGCSESVVSRELTAAVETLRRFLAKRHVQVASVALTGLLTTHAASATMVGSAAMVSAMMATTVAAPTLFTALMQSKPLIVVTAMVGSVSIALAGYHLMPSNGQIQWRRAQVEDSSSREVSLHGKGETESIRSTAKKKAKGIAAHNNSTWQGKWEGAFKYTSAMALDEQKKKVLLQADPEARYALLQQMGVRLTRAAFDALAAKNLDASVAPWRDTLTVLANRTDMFDNYLMAWSNEDPMAVLNWVTSQPDGGLGMRKQLLYTLSTRQLPPEELRSWIERLTSKSMKHEATIALDSMHDTATLIARMGTGDNEGFLVDLAMLQGDRLNWSAFAQKLAVGKGEIVARAMRQMLDGVATPENINQVIQELSRSTNTNISAGAVAVLRASRGDPSLDYHQALQLAAQCDQAGMSDFSATVYQGWAVAHPQEAVQYTSSLKNLAHLRNVIGALSPPPDEATLVSWMTDSPWKARDIALASLYSRSGGDSSAQLQKIMQSSTIMDQVEAAKEVMRMLPLHEASAAAQWLTQMPAGKDRQELATALINKLSAVDPQATLDLAQREGIQGPDYSRAITSAVTQYAAQNDLTQSTGFIQQISDPKCYAEALGQLAMVKFPGHPEEAFNYLQANSRDSNWQSSALHMLTDVYYNKLGNVDANASAILKLDLSKLGGTVATRANIFCKAWIDQRVPLEVPLAWTQQLPPNLGREARLQLARNNTMKAATIRQYQTWVQTATITPAERTQLINVFNRRLADPTTR